MRILFTMLLCCAIGGVAGAVDHNLSPVVPDKDTYVGDGASDGREGGENFGDAAVIPSLPYYDTGATCDNSADIYGSCYGDYGAPDVVYSYTPGANETVTVSLCGSQYDTGLSIFDAGLNEIYCNDDYCGLQSELQNLPLSAGMTYYIVVDGYYTNCGSYVLNVTGGGGGCELECPDGALDEGEVDCYDGYWDTTNGGCNSEGWTDICPQDGTHAVMCGTSGTYLYNGLSYRDTDWIRIYGAGGNLTATCEAEFPLQFIYFYVAGDCNNYAYDYMQVPECTPATFTYNVAQGTEQWVWVGGSQFTGIPCGSLWVLTLDGIWCEGTAVENTSWGAIKNLYK